MGRAGVTADGQQPFLVIGTIEGAPAEPPRRRTRAELDAEFAQFVAAGFPNPSFLAADRASGRPDRGSR